MGNKIFWILCAALVTSVNFACAAEGVTTVAPPAIFKEPTTGMQMVYVKGGCYQMGATENDIDAYPEEMPSHKVCVADFYMGKYEVTQGEWKSIMGSDTSVLSACRGGNCPVDAVSWINIQEFIRKLNSSSGESKYRLPTEAEWEYAARSRGKSEKYSGGKNLNSVAWYTENSGRKNHPVGTKAPNGLDIYDMSGNVWEWTNDWYGSDYYKNSPSNNPAGPNSGVDRVARGGCATGEAANQRVSRRNGYAPDFSKPDLGFRLLRIP